jgi:hypothetical protein
MQGLTDEIVRDPTSVELDAFAKQHRKELYVPGKHEMNMVVEEHAIIAQSPYAIDYDELSKPTQSRQ